MTITTNEGHECEIMFSVSINAMPSNTDTLDYFSLLRIYEFSNWCDFAASNNRLATP